MITNLGLQGHTQQHTWKIIHETVERSKDMDNLAFTQHGITIEDPVTVSNLFNHYFITVASNGKTVIDNKMSSDYQYVAGLRLFDAGKTFNCKLLHSKEVEEIIDSLKNKPSTGHDEIPLKVIKQVKQELLNILTHLINWFLDSKSQINLKFLGRAHL